MEKCGGFYGLDRCKNNRRSRKRKNAVFWKYAKEFEPFEVTLEEIAKWKGVSKEQIIIKMNEKITELPLEGKYLEYSPEITFDIFKLVWDKLISLGYKSSNSLSAEYRYDEFKGKYPYFREPKDRPLALNCFGTSHNFKETTVQEILGYNPFIKETTTVKDWNKATEEELLEEAKRRYPIGCKVKLIRHNTGGDFKNEVMFTKYKFFGNSKVKQLYVDGNLLLFDNGIWAEIESLPEVETKKVIPEYIKCIKPQSVYFIPGNVYKVLDTEYIDSCKIISNIKCSHYEENTLLWVSLADASYFKPSTKEAFEAQIEKRLSFYVKYCDEFTEDLLKSLIEWSQKNNTLKNRGRDNSFRGLKNDGYFVFDNFGLCSPINKSYIDKHNYGYGVYNNTQNCFTEYSIKQVKELIGYKEQKPIEKWNVGSYIVPLQNKLLTRSEFLIKGKPYQIIKYTSLPYIISEKGEEINFIDDDNTEKNEGIKWFATKHEAEEFAKSLITPIKEEVRQAVHCKTKEEWDFVKNKVNRDNDWEEDYPCQILVGKTHWKGEVQFCIDEGIQILSFQEGCSLNGYKMETKQSLKQVVQCITHEEWEFVISKLSSSSKLSRQRNKFERFIKENPNGIAVNTMKDSWSDIDYWKEEGYQILSFQEWCKLNNYGMNKKKYTIKELETNHKLIIYIDSKEEHDKIKKVSKRIREYCGNYCYSLYEGTYSSSSSKFCIGAFSKDSIILTIDDIIFEDNIENGNKEISDESYIGKYVSFNYFGRFYDEAFIIRENSYIYLLNNCHSNNNGHINKSIYKHSLRFDSTKEMLLLCKDIKFLDFKDIKFKPLTASDLICGIDGASNLVWGTDKIKLIYLQEPD